MKSLFFTMALVGLGMLSPLSNAQAQEAQGELFVVLASPNAGAVDPSLAREPALQQAPFNMFHSMRVLERRGMSLRSAQAFTTQLPNGRTLRVELLGTTPDHRYRVRVSINRAGQTDYLQLLTVVAAPGDPFFVVGQNYQGGTLVIGLRIGAQAGHAQNLVQHAAPSPRS